LDETKLNLEWWYLELCSIQYARQVDFNQRSAYSEYIYDNS